MVDLKKNIQINQALTDLYEAYCQDYLDAYCSAFHDPKPPCRINEFGIIDVNRYDTDAGILFIAKETNGWSNQDFESGYLFRSWLEGISQDGIAGKGHVQRHPNMWYNLGRWALYLSGVEQNINTIALSKQEALRALGTVAFTNLNKVRGMNHSGRAYRMLAASDISGQLLSEELKLLHPKTIVCCGTVGVFRTHVPDFSGAVISMPHPAARIATLKMLHHIEAQMPR